jgi:CRP-like cAMP-binding protein
MGAGSLLAPALLAVVGLDASFLAAAAVLLGAAAIAAIALRTGNRPSELVESRVQVLAGLSLFAGAPRFALEGLAAECREERPAPGAVLIREGDPPDDLFVVVEGSVSVTAGPANRPLATLGPGDFFGEIGLIKGVPRTASVTVASPAVVLRIDGELFLSLVRTGVAHGGTLGRSVGVRLARQESIRG